MAAARKAVVVACVAAVHEAVEAVPLQVNLADMWPLAQEVLACHLLEIIDPRWTLGSTPPTAAAVGGGAIGPAQIANSSYGSTDAVELAAANFNVFQTIMVSTDEQRLAAVEKMGPMIRKRAKSVPQISTRALELPTEVSAALDQVETEAGRLVSTPLVQRDLKDPTVQAWPEEEKNHLPRRVPAAGN